MQASCRATEIIEVGQTVVDGASIKHRQELSPVVKIKDAFAAFWQLMQKCATSSAPLMMFNGKLLSDRTSIAATGSLLDGQ